jgi:gliding motility-associated-like protein
MKFKKFLILFLFLNYSFIFSQAPIVSADGIQLYCPGTKLHVATSFSITPAASETGQIGLYIQISQGYVNGEDTLSLLNPANFPDINKDWSATEGKLTLTHITNPEILYSEIEALLLDVVFESTSLNPQKDKTFSISIGDANYLPSEDHYYKYIADAGVTWSGAKTKAEGASYYGLKGYLATLRTLDEAILCGKQALGAGWIGASDASVEGTWEWVTGPEGIIPFWQGNGSGGPINGEYANWNDPNEPNNSNNEDYGHITYNLGPGTVGEWNDLSNTGNTDPASNYYPQGYVVEFGGSPGDPTLSITDFTEIIMPRIIAPNPIVPEIICGPDTVTFTVQTNTLAPTDPLNDIEVQWYDSASGGTLLETGLSFTTPSLSANTTYYALPVKYDGTTACTSTANRIPFEVIYYEKPELIVPSPQPFEQCNNTVFDLVALQSSLSVNAATETFEFYNSAGTLIDPSNGLDPSSYTFTGSSTSNQETISVIITSNSSVGLTPVCNTLTNITLKLGACDIPSSFPVLDEVLCETSTDPLGGGQDGFETFDKSIFDNIEADLITAEPLFGIFGTEINFFRSDADATAGVSTTAIDKTADYTTSAGQGFTFNATENRWEQELWVRVENTTLGTACFDTQQVATLYINKLPELLTPTVDVNQCDVGIFNLTDQEDNLSSNYANEEFEYYDSTGILIDPINGLDPTNYAANGQNEIITVTIKTKPSLGTACINTTATINLAWSVTTLPAGYTLKDEYLVETDPDPKGQGQDGVETFDKSIFTTVQSDLITAEPAFSGKTFSFYRSQNDALTSSNKIDTTVDFATDEQTNDGFTFNTAENRWEQQIWIYIEDNVTTAIATCYGLYHIATVYVEKRPVFYDVTMQELCDEQTPLDMKSLFDTTSLFSEFTTDPTGTVTQDTSLFTVEYTYVDDTGAPKTLEPTLPSNFNTTDQTITVTLTNNSTNSALAAGVSSGTIEFKVYQQPVAYPSDPSVPGVYTFVECDDDNDGLAVGEEVFDMSSITTRLLTDISGTYAAQDPNDFDFEYSVAGTIITLGSDYTATTGDQIEVKITNPLYPVCEETITIDFIVNPLPSFDIDDTTVICLNLTQPVEIGTSNWNGAADPSIYTYSWTLDSDPSFSETTETIFPVKGGIYTVVVEDPITFCTQTKSITVTESDIASIDLDDDGDVTDTEYDHFIEVLDLTDDNTNTIKINNIADLGIGDYEFSLDNFNYQDDNEFTDLDPGVYTLYIRDKNSYYSYTYGCGILEVTVSVIGYKKYFTPNNDGINDKWKILGIRIDFNNASEIYIFNRYGKLLKQLDPITDGWDGTYLGKPMPATDYWFRVYLEDGREFKGHFSLIRGKN